MRCFLFRYGDGTEVLRWFLPDPDSGWMQQLFKMTLPDGPLLYTGDDPNAVVFSGGVAASLDEGRAEEL